MATKSIVARRQIDDVKGVYDWGLITVVTTLLFLGIVFVFSASFVVGLSVDNPYLFAGRQLLSILIGVAILIVVARIPYTYWQRLAIPIMAATLLALLAVLLFGAEVNNARRTLFGTSIQPGEAAKLGVVIYAAAWLTSKGDRIRQVSVGLLPFSVLLGIVGMLLYFQPSFSTAILIISTAFIMFFIAGAAIGQLISVFVIGAGTFWLVFEYSPLAGHARDRIDKYLDALWNPLQSEHWQVWQSINALVRGGIFGVGVGEATAKQPGYVPLTWQDNIYTLIGEEVGLIGGLFIILLYALLAYCGLRIALRARENFGAILATGITTLITLQAVLHMAVAVSMTPPTGQPLPFVSFGGSSMVTMLAAVGILLSISRGLNQPGSTAKQDGAKSASSGKSQNARFDFGWRDWGSRLPGVSSHNPIDPTTAGGNRQAGPGILSRLWGDRRPARTRRRI